MKRGRKENFSKVITPYQIVSSLSEEERVFCLLHALCGYPSSKAYQIAYKGVSNATLSSCAAQASRLLRERRIFDYLNRLYRFTAQGSLILFNENAMKYP